MSIVEMSKIRLVGLKSEKNAVMDVLSRCHRFEPRPTAQIEGTEFLRDESHLEKVLAKQARLAFAIDFLRSNNAEAERKIKDAKKLKKEVGFSYLPYKDGGRPIITYADFYDCAAKEYELLHVCDELDKISFRQAEIRSETSKLDNDIRALLPYEGLSLPFSSAKQYKKTCVLIFQSSNKQAATKAVVEGFDVVTQLYPCNGGVAMVLVCHISQLTEIKAKLAESGWIGCQFTEDVLARDKIAELTEKKDQLKRESEKLFAHTLSLEKHITELKTLYDFLSADAERFMAEADFARTGSAYVLEGWIPKRDAEVIAAEIKNRTANVVIYITEPEEGDIPPTLLDNPKAIKPFEGITNMYSTPAYTERDPNGVMAIFFFIIFGMMMADAGYGLVLALACTFIVRFTKMERGVKSLAAVFGICGISALIWGALFGSYFGLGAADAKIFGPLWFNPLEDPLMMLVVCIVLGVIHLLAGYTYQAYYLIKQGKPWDAVFDVGLLYVLFVGVGMLALPMAIKSLPKIVSDVGLYVLLGSLVAIFLTGGRHKKGILGKITGGVGGLYGLVNLFSDVLSYARIFGIALAGGAIASAFNAILGVIIGIPYAGYPIAVVLGVFLHVFNLLISLLGAYVHNARLQFLEFYGKFYTGEGKQFTPMGEKTKYVRFE